MKRITVQSKLAGGMICSVQVPEATTLLVLVEKGQRGVVDYDFFGGPAFRLPAYTWNLHQHGIMIEIWHEKHDIGWHGRFLLHAPDEIVSVIDPARRIEIAVAALPKRASAKPSPPQSNRICCRKAVRDA